MSSLTSYKPKTIVGMLNLKAETKWKKPVQRKSEAGINGLKFKVGQNPSDERHQ